ncbi:hypothetical protein O181_019134 [Austropuccinia psidii MF-1]|uniref:Uncharacterized protein n=1 Tax=Austropuccinia psidii MF-1 TaxID=1389203 RepID=A0A9Q3C8Y7_9BASI|nr:hypothetical protein [Austropuccinia psidii MF-1]
MIETINSEKEPSVVENCRTSKGPVGFDCVHSTLLCTDVIMDYVIIQNPGNIVKSEHPSLTTTVFCYLAIFQQSDFRGRLTVTYSRITSQALALKRKLIWSSLKWCSAFSHDVDQKLQKQSCPKTS